MVKWEKNQRRAAVFLLWLSSSHKQGLTFFFVWKIMNY